MIRVTSHHVKLRRAVSLLEMTYVLLVIGFILGVVWVKAADVYANYDVMQAGKQLNLIVQATRLMHTSDKVTGDENADLMNLPSDTIGHFKGHAIIFNPWRGRVSLFPGNALALGDDRLDDEFTIRYDGVPSSSCTDMVMQNTSRSIQALGLVAVAVAPPSGQGKEICFAQDAICKNTVSSLLENHIDHLCHEKSRMTVMFTFGSH